MFLIHPFYSEVGYLSFQTDYDVDPLRMPSHVTLVVSARDKGNLQDSVSVELIIKVGV